MRLEMPAAGRFLCTVVLVLALAGCSTMSEVETASLAQAPIPNGKARVTIKRPGTVLYVGTAATISLNGQTVADIGSGGSAVFEVPAGTNVLKATSLLYPGEYSFKLDAQPGQSYVLEVAPREASVGPAVVFGVLGGAIDAATNENSGLFEIRKPSARPSQGT